MANVKTKKAEKQSSKQQQISQERKHASKKITSRKKKQRVKKAIIDSPIKKQAKRTTQKKPLKKDIYMGAPEEATTLKTGKVRKNKKKTIKDFLEREFLKLQQIDQEKTLAKEELSISERQKEDTCGNSSLDHKRSRYPSYAIRWSNCSNTKACERNTAYQNGRITKDNKRI
ncbi:hypothetical protein LCGC14_2558260 [marine sediment metagenome]|uniref:Uncharacterized protein n=1 Tax=marine sediment metagenome TaxID=412755 RepID=A0A0F9CX56_9ZZZZ